MVVHQVFAQVFEGEIKNIIVCDNFEMANWLSRATYGDTACAVDCLQYPCAIGDGYHDGVFWHEDGDKEVPIVPLVVPERSVPILSAKLDYLSMMTEIEMEVVNE